MKAAIIALLMIVPFMVRSGSKVTVCTGQKYMAIPDSVIGGVWSSGNTSIATIGSEDWCVITGVSSGTTTMYYTLNRDTLTTINVTVTTCK